MSQIIWFCFLNEQIAKISSIMTQNFGAWEGCCRATIGKLKDKEMVGKVAWIINNS